MKKGEKSQKKIEIGKPGYLNKNCWLVKTLNYSPYKRCQYCELKFRNCLFLHYQIVSSILIIIFLTLSLLIEGTTSKLVIISVFVLVIVYGYFFNKSTEKIINANFSQRKAKEALEELTKTLEQRVDEQTKEIRELLKIKSEFLTVASHQLRTPVSIVRGYLSMIDAQDVKGKEREDFIHKAFLASNHMEQVVHDLLTVTELEGGRLQVKIRPVDIVPFIIQLIEERKKLAQDKGLKLIFDLKQKKFPQVLVDGLKINDIIGNLVDNAIHYTSQGSITVTLDIQEEMAKISVIDTGIGFSAEDKEKLFRKFSRSKEALKVNPNGSGMGLYVVMLLTKQMNGKVEAESPGQGKGATFSVYLLLAK